MAQDEKSVEDMARETKDAAVERAGDLRRKAEEKASEAWESGKSRARAAGETAKSRAASETEQTADAVRRAAEKFEEGDFRAQAASQLAEGLTAVADRIRQKDLGDIPGDLRRFARSNPTMFYAGAALLGFALVRAAKASERHADDDPMISFSDQDDLTGDDAR